MITATSLVSRPVSSARARLEPRYPRSRSLDPHICGVAQMIWHRAGSIRQERSSAMPPRSLATPKGVSDSSRSSALVTRPRNACAVSPTMPSMSLSERAAASLVARSY